MAESALVELPSDCVQTAAELYTGLQQTLAVELECDEAMAEGGVLVRRRLVQRAAQVLAFWSRLQPYGWAGDARRSALEGCLRERVGDIARGLLPLADPAATTQHGYDVVGAARQCAFLAVAKSARLAGCGAADQDLTPGQCGLTGAAYGAEALDDVPIRAFGPRRALAVVELLSRAHGALAYEEKVCRFLNGLLRRVTEACVLVDDQAEAAVEGTVSMMDSIARLGTEDAHSAAATQLLIAAERLFAGLQRDAGSLNVLPRSVLPPAGCLAPPTARPLETARLLTELLAALALRKEVQRVSIETREALIASVLCSYGRGGDARHGLVEDGRRKHVVLYDRLCYKPLAKLVDVTGALSPDLEDGGFECRGGTQAAVFGTVLAVTQVQYGDAATAWLRARARWAPWPEWSEEGPLRCRRVLDALVDSEGEVHSSVVSFLAKLLDVSPADAPAELTAALADRGWTPV
jgi:hypothetical protein